MTPLGVQDSDVVTFTRAAFVERRWRWSWWRLRWEPLTIAEDYVFRNTGGCLEGMEPWRPL